MSTDVRNQVMAEIIGVMVDGVARGAKPISVAQRAFPGTPDAVLYEAEAEVEDAQVETWWNKIERTIQGSLIRNAIADLTEDSGSADSREVELDEAFDALIAETTDLPF